MHQLPDLPYPKKALAPHISEETLEYHYGKHHQAYVNNLNKMIEGTEFAGMSLEDTIRKATGGMFNNAAQIWNHTFYWHCMSPDGGGQPKGALAAAIDRAATLPPMRAGFDLEGASHAADILLECLENPGLLR